MLSNNESNPAITTRTRSIKSKVPIINPKYCPISNNIDTKNARKNQTKPSFFFFLHINKYNLVKEKTHNAFGSEPTKVLNRKSFAPVWLELLMEKTGSEIQ